MPFLSAEILNFQDSAHLIGVGSLSNKLFNPVSPHSSKFRNITIEINEYFNQEDNTSCDDMWEGNHRYVNDCRNKMTHRNSPNVSAMSDYDINMKQHPTCMLKRIIEDYAVVTRYIVDILEKIEGEIKKIYKGTYKKIS